MRALVILFVLMCSFSLQANNDFQKLKAAVDTRDFLGLQRLVEDPNIDINARELSQKKGTILHYLMRDGDFLRDAPGVFMDFLDTLLVNHADVNAITSFGETPLHQAARYLGKYELGRHVVKRFLDHPEIEANRRVHTVEEVALHVAARFASEPGFVQEFLDDSKVDVNGENKVGETPVMVAALFSASPDVIRAVVHHERVNLEVDDKFGNTVWDLMWKNAYLPPDADKAGLMRYLVQESERKYKLKQGCYGL